MVVVSLLRRRLRLPGPQRTIVGQWQRALLLDKQKLVKQIVESSDPSAWDRDASAVVEAMFEIAVPRYFRPHPYEHQLDQFLIELQATYPDKRTPRRPDIEALIRATLGEPDAAIGHVDSLRRFSIHSVVVDLIVQKLSMTRAAIDDLILEGERAAFERGWKPALADR
jgi:hypothetical protein